MQNTGDKDAKVTFLTMEDNSSGQMVATAVQKKGHDKFVEHILLKSLESVLQTKERDRSMWQNTWQVKEKRQPSSDRPPRKAANQTSTLSKHTRSVEAMARTMKKVISDKAQTKLSAKESITRWMIRHAASLQTRLSVGTDS